MVIQGREMCENEGKGDRKTAMEKCREDIFRERGRESFSLPARGMTHLLPADRRMDGDKERGWGWWRGGQSWEEEGWSR